MEFTVDINDVMFVNIDRRRKIPVAVLLKAMGFDSNQAIIRLFHQVENVKISVRAGKKEMLNVRFEDFISEPERVVKEACKYIGMDFEEAMLDIDLSKSNVGRWKQELSKAQVERVEKELADVFAFLKY